MMYDSNNFGSMFSHTYIVENACVKKWGKISFDISISFKVSKKFKSLRPKYSHMNQSSQMSKKSFGFLDVDQSRYLHFSGICTQITLKEQKLWNVVTHKIRTFIHRLKELRSEGFDNMQLFNKMNQKWKFDVWRKKWLYY